MIWHFSKLGYFGIIVEKASFNPQRSVAENLQANETKTADLDESGGPDVGRL